MDNNSSSSVVAEADITHRLRDLIADCEQSANQHDLAIICIGECIDHGIVVGTNIVAQLSAVGFKARFIGLTLNKGTGDDPTRHHWRRDDYGHYQHYSPSSGKAPTPLVISAAHIRVPDGKTSDFGCSSAAA